MGYSTVEESTPPTEAPEEDTTLANKVDALTEQVQLLRDEQIERELAHPVAIRNQPIQTPAQEKAIPTILVYRDGRQSEVQNFAIQGKTLWVFGGQTTRKVPLSDLDLDVTKKLNEDRGVEFVSEGSI
jgi:hypothetical protein